MSIHTGCLHGTWAVFDDGCLLTYKVTSAMPYSVYAPKERNIPVLLQNIKSVHIQGRPMYAPRAYRVHVLRPPYKKGPSREKQKVPELHYLRVCLALPILPLMVSAWMCWPDIGAAEARMPACQGS